MTFKFSYITKPGSTKTKSFESLEALRKGAIAVLGTATPRFDGDYFVGKEGVCLVPCMPTTPKDLFPEVGT